MPLTTPLKRPTLFSQKIFVSKKQTNKTKKNKWLLENRTDTHFNTPKTSTTKWKVFIYKRKAWIKVGRNYDCDISRKKIRTETDWWRIFFCVCACCVLTKFFWSSLRGSCSTLLVENNPFVIPIFRLHFFLHPTKQTNKTSAAFCKHFCLWCTQSVEKTPSSNTSVNII